MIELCLLAAPLIKQLVFLYGELLVHVGVLLMLYGLSQRLGPAPFYLFVGIELACLELAFREGLTLGLPWDIEVRFTSVNHLVPLMVAFLLLYTLEGISEARRFMVSIALGVLACIGLLSAFVAAADLTHIRWANFTPQPEALEITVHVLVLSGFTLVCDAVALIITYQGLLRLLRRLRSARFLVASTGALVVALLVDGLIFTTGFNLFEARMPGVAHWINRDLLGKVLAAIPAGLAVAPFITYELRRHGQAGEDGVVERGMFDIIRMRQALDDAASELLKTREKYQFIKDTFARYVNRSVVDRLVQNPDQLKLGGERREVTVLFSDIEGYTTLSETLEPEQVILLLNRYFTAMTEVIFDEGGTITEFEGDGILLMFGAPEEQPDHADRAIRCALRMQGRMERLNDEWEAEGTARLWQQHGVERLRMRIGVHSGPVIVGNVGSFRRIKYGIIGDTVNTAHRVESMNKELGTQLLLSDETLTRMTAQTGIRDLGTFNVKGRGAGVRVHTTDPELPTIVDETATE